MSWSIARVEHFNEQESRAAQCIRAASESKRTLSIEGGGTRAFWDVLLHQVMCCLHSRFRGD